VPEPSGSTSQEADDPLLPGPGLLDGFFFGAGAAASAWLAGLLLHRGVTNGWQAGLLVPFWLLVTYLVLPRVHRILTRLYVPGYFIGRTRTSDGLLGDPVNLALLGHEAQLHAALLAAGWTRADDLSVRTAWRIVSSTLRRRSYTRAPVSPLHLFERQQDFAYQQEVAASPSKRHHVRFWRSPPSWLLPGGHPADWLAASTYDRSVGLSLFTLQITHKIDVDTDVERDFLVETVRAASPAARASRIEQFSTGYHARNGGGDRIRTDGDLPVLDLRGVPAPDRPNQPTTDSRDRRPAQVVFGSAVVLLRAVLLVTLAVVLLARPDLADLTVTAQVTARTVAVVLVALAVVDAVASVAVARGRNGARLLVLTLSLLTALGTFTTTLGGAQPVALAQLPALAASILVLLALSSSRAREFALRAGARRRAGHAPAGSRAGRSSADPAPGSVSAGPGHLGRRR
jgi:hypothetical protein